MGERNITADARYNLRNHDININAPRFRSCKNMQRLLFITSEWLAKYRRRDAPTNHSKSSHREEIQCTSPMSKRIPLSKNRK